MILRKRSFAAFLVATITALYSVVGSSQTVPSDCTPITSVRFLISTPGKYCLMQNILADSNGIVVAANDVTIDLQGHTLRSFRPGLPLITTYGIVTSSEAVERWNLTIKNGTISGFTSGILLNYASNVLIEAVRIEGDPQQASTGVLANSSRAPVIIRGNQIANVAYGVFLNRAAASVVDNNVIQLFDANVAPLPLPRGNRVGVFLDVYSHGVVVSKNVIRNTTSSVFTQGIRVALVAGGPVSNGVVIEHNNVSNVGDGINAYGSSSVKYKNNVVSATTPYSGGTDIGGNY